MPVSSAGDIAGVGVGVGCLLTPISRPEAQTDAVQRRKAGAMSTRPSMVAPNGYGQG